MLQEVKEQLHLSVFFQANKLDRMIAATLARRIDIDISESAASAWRRSIELLRNQSAQSPW